MLVERGLLDVDAPVAAYWPEFGMAGKERIPLGWVLSHRSGVAAVDAPVTMEDVLGWDGVVAAVAAQAPNWEPGTEHGYHARTYGWILGEVIRRATGRSVRRYPPPCGPDPEGGRGGSTSRPAAHRWYRAENLWRTATNQLQEPGSPLWQHRSRRRHLEVLTLPLKAAQEAAGALGGR